MKKQYLAITGNSLVIFPNESYDVVEAKAKNYTAKNGYECGVYELVAQTKAPVAAIEVVKVTA